MHEVVIDKRIITDYLGGIEVRHMTTIKEIARLAGVSRGTVDRVLNNRGSVSPDTADKIREIARALDYHPNRAGTALAAQKKRCLIGVVLFGEDNPFFDQVMEGAEARAGELRDYGVEVRALRTDFDVDAQLSAIDALTGEGIRGLVLAPYNDARIRDKIDELSDMGIPVVTVNTDIAGSRRLSYVGSDYLRDGAVAAGLLALMTEGDVRLGIVTGSSDILCHTDRVEGLRGTLAARYPRIHILEIVENRDDEFISYSLTRELLARHPDMDALFFAAAGVYGGCQAVIESGRTLKVISFDEVPTTMEMLSRGVISATIGQQALWQGSLPIDILFEYLTTDIAPSEKNIADLSIRIRESCL